MHKLRTAIDIFKSSGASGVFRQACKCLRSSTAFWLLEKSWDHRAKCNPAGDPGIVLRQACRDDLESIAAAWPTEFKRLAEDPSGLRRELEARFDEENPCFIASRGQRVLGAVWCKAWKYDDALPRAMQGRPAYENLNIFTAVEARGKGVAGELLLFSMDRMADRGKTVAYSFILTERLPSILAHEKVGFRRIGVMTFGRRLGRHYRRLDTSAVGEGRSLSPQQ